MNGYYSVVKAPQHTIVCGFPSKFYRATLYYTKRTTQNAYK